MDLATDKTRADVRKGGWTPLGGLLREWRGVRRVSQLELALRVACSTRHLSYVETGKARPGRPLVLAIAEALELPLRERNALLVAAGYAPAYQASPLAAPHMGLIRSAIEATLAQHAPYPAFVADRHWNVVDANAGLKALLGALKPGGPRHANVLLQIFDPDDMRPWIANWSEVAADLLRHLHNEISRFPTDTAARSLLARLTAFPDVPEHWARRDPRQAPLPVITTAFHGPRGELRFFSTLTTFVGGSDITAEDLRIEAMHPVDETTRLFCRDVARRASAG